MKKLLFLLLLSLFVFTGFTQDLLLKNATLYTFDKGVLEDLKQKGRTLGLAYRVRARIYTEEKKDVLKVPRTALFRGGNNQWQVFSVKKGKAALVPVALGIVNDEEAAITRGLSDGDTIIVAPPKALRNGDRVKPS